MSFRNTFGPDYFRMLQYERLMQSREAMVDFMNGKPAQYELIFNALRYGNGLGFDYADHLDDFTDDDDDDYDDENVRQNNTYCGLGNNFLGNKLPKYVPAEMHYKALRATPEEAAKNAEELVAEEEKLKKKAEKKKLKKMRQRERRRLEKLEKENGNKGCAKNDPAAVAVKSKTTDSESDSNNKKKKNSVPPDPGTQCSSVTTEGSGSCDEEEDDDDDDDDESIVDELELDMSSCFVSNAAAIAKRKFDQKPDRKVEQKHDRKEKKSEGLKNYGRGQKSTLEPQIAFKEASEELKRDNVTKSMELAVVGNRCAQTGNLDMAVKYFTDAIKHNPQEFKLFGNRSFCYEKMQQYDKALTDADIALSMNPTWIRGLYRKGKALVGLKRYHEAGLTYKEVLKLDSSCADAAQELMRVQIMQLMDMGYTKEQSSNALIIHGTIEKALEALSGLQGNMVHAQVPAREIRVCPERNPQAANFPLRTILQNSPNVSTAVPATPELFPVWVGDLAPAITQLKLYELFSNFGKVHSVRLLQASRCAFINYVNKEDCEKAIKEMHGFHIAGTYLTVRYPDRIHTHLGVSKAATTDAGKVNKFPDECYFWRTTGCIKNNRCQYRHVPEHKGIDRPKAK